MIARSSPNSLSSLVTRLTIWSTTPESMIRVEMSMRSATGQRYSAGSILGMVDEIRGSVDRLRLGVARGEPDRACRRGVEDLPFAVRVVELGVVAHVLGERGHGRDISIVGVVVMQRGLHVVRRAAFDEIIGSANDCIARNSRIATAARRPRRGEELHRTHGPGRGCADDPSHARLLKVDRGQP